MFMIQRALRGDLSWEQWILEQKLTIVMVIFGILFLSLVMSCQELRYMTSGKVVEAGGNARDETYIDHGQKLTHRVLTYNYTDGDNPRGQTIEVPRDWNGSQNGTVKIQYIPGRDTSRLLGQSNKIWVYIFFGSLAAAVAGAFIMVKYG